MILDHIAQHARYHELHPLFARAFEFLERKDIREIPPGKLTLVEDKLYAIIERGPGRAPESGRLEAHRRFIDIQFVLDGCDTMGWRALPSCLSVDEEYDPSRDIVFFREPPSSWVSVHAGHFVVFFPEDAHLPMVSQGTLHKVVIKIAVD